MRALSDSAQFRVFTAAILSAGALSSASIAQGSVAAWGGDGVTCTVVCAPTDAGFTRVAAGQAHSLALRSDGSIHSWGFNTWSDPLGLVNDTPTGTGFTQIAAGCEHSIALSADGSIVSWGQDDEGLVSETPPGTGFTHVAAGEIHSLAVRADGSIAAWGSDFAWIHLDAPSGTGFSQVAAGRWHSLALRTDGSLQSWGANVFYDEVAGTPSGTDFVQVAASGHSSAALRADGSIEAWGFLSNYATPSGTGFVQVSVGGGHAVARHADGSIVSWGDESPSGVISTTPGAPIFSDVAAGLQHSLAVGDTCTLGFDATETIRSGQPANAAFLLKSQLNGPVIGSTWDPVVSNLYVPGFTSVADFMLIASEPANIPLGAPGTLLCDLSTLIAMVAAPAPGVPFAVPVPNNCALVTVSFSAQGVSIDASGVANLTAALDATIGTF